MNEKKMTLQDWIYKADWEGGIYGAYDYGLRYDDLDDEGKASELGQALIKVEELWPALEAAEEAMSKMVDELDLGDN